MSTRKEGKKIGFLKIDGPIRHHTVELRYVPKIGKFYADLCGEQFTAETEALLTKKLEAAAKALDNAKYTWWIEHELDTWCANSYGSWNSGFEPGRDDNRVDGFKFRFRCVELSEPLEEHDEATGGRYQVCNRRDLDVGEDGMPYADDEHRHYQRHVVRRPIEQEFILYTPERWLMLCEIKKRLQQLHRRLYDLLGGEGKTDEITARLDALNMRRLLLGEGENK